MRRLSKITSIFFLLLVLAVFLFINTSLCQGPITYSINADGTITPKTSFITLSGNTYCFTGNFSGSINVYASNVIIDGKGFTLQGLDGVGIWLKEVNNVTIRNLTVIDFFMSGLYLTSSSNDTIYFNNFSSNDYCGIDLENASNNNNIFENTLTNNCFAGIRLSDNSPIPNVGAGSDFNHVYDNKISENLEYGIFVGNSSNNKIYQNDISNNSDAGIGISSSSNNEFYLNNLIGNSPNAKVGGEIDYFTGTGIGGSGANIWDNGSAGNYWSDYKGQDSNHDGIGDKAYRVDANNVDNYPLMTSFGVTTLLSGNKQVSQPIQTALLITIVGVAAALVGISLFYNFKKRQSQR